MRSDILTNIFATHEEQGEDLVTLEVSSGEKIADYSGGSLAGTSAKRQKQKVTRLDNDDLTHIICSHPYGQAIYTIYKYTRELSTLCQSVMCDVITSGTICEF